MTDSQSTRILEALQRGERLTSLQAFRRFGSLAFHSRVSGLRERGYNIHCELVTRNGKRFGVYTLIGR